MPAGGCMLSMYGPVHHAMIAMKPHVFERYMWSVSRQLLQSCHVHDCRIYARPCGPKLSLRGIDEHGLTMGRHMAPISHHRECRRPRCADTKFSMVSEPAYFEIRSMIYFKV